MLQKSVKNEKRGVEKMKKWMAAILAATLSFGAVPAAAADYGTCTLTYADGSTITFEAVQQQKQTITIDYDGEEIEREVRVFVAKPGSAVTATDANGDATGVGFVGYGDHNGNEVYNSSPLSFYLPEGGAMDEMFTMGGYGTPGDLTDYLAVYDPESYDAAIGYYDNMIYVCLGDAEVAQPEENAPSAWAKEMVESAKAAGMVPALTGDPAYTDAITREQFAELAVQTVFACTGEKTQAAASGTFTDTQSEVILQAYAAKIVSGVGNGQFGPKTTSNREQIATMIANTISYLESKSGVDLTPNAGSVAAFSDQSQVSSWAVGPMGLLAANGIMGGTSATTLSPKSPCTVEQSIVLLYHVYENYQAAME